MAKKTDPRVDEFILKKSQWTDALFRLRSLLLSTDLDETIKWGMPTYTIGTKNVVGMGAFKSYFGLWFFNGAALSDESGVLINAQEGKTKSLRQWRFTSADELDDGRILAYLEEALDIQRALNAT